MGFCDTVCYILVNGVLSQRLSVEPFHPYIGCALPLCHCQDVYSEHNGLSVKFIGVCLGCVLSPGVGVFSAQSSFLLGIRCSVRNHNFAEIVP
jgi:hypothetical protein